MRATAAHGDRRQSVGSGFEASNPGGQSVRTITGWVVRMAGVGMRQRLGQGPQMAPLGQQRSSSQISIPASVWRWAELATNLCGARADKLSRWVRPPERKI
jgi:hypothetical protein